MPPAQQRSGRRERVVLGAYLLASYMAVLSLIVGATFRAGRRTVPPDAALARTALVVAVTTLVAAVALAIRYFGFAPGTRLILREAWPGLLTGAGLAIITGGPVRAFVPADTLWLVLTLVYVSGLVIIRWFARRAPAAS